MTEFAEDDGGVDPNDPEYRQTDALTHRLERALEMACDAAVFDRLSEIAALCDEAAQIARGWPAQIPPPRPWA
jgi:hypothetical protein